MLVAASAVGLYRLHSGNSNKLVDVISLTLIGMTLFQTIFEARTRYFYVNSSFLIMAGFFGWLGIVRTWRGLRIKLIDKLENDIAKEHRS